jgi:phosphoglycolate phosphatase-like HAD superfamily hydrolase
MSTLPLQNALLVLFDVDGTLLLSKRAGARSMVEAARRMHGAEITTDGVQFAGRLDQQIWAQIATRNGIRDHESREAEFRALYVELLKELLDSAPMAYPLPGIVDLIASLQSERGFTLGILTGNFADSGRLKIRAAGIDLSRFPISVWADDGSERRDLPRVAIQRYRELTGQSIESGRVVIVGDTPHDIDCAHANRCLALAVATGPTHSLADLQACGPDWAVENLSETENIVNWLRDKSGTVTTIPKLGRIDGGD